MPSRSITLRWVVEPSAICPGPAVGRRNRGGEDWSPVPTCRSARLRAAGTGPGGLFGTLAPALGHTPRW